MNKLPAETPFENTGKGIAHVGAISIKPGHTRMVPTTQHPDYHKMLAALDQSPAPDTRFADLLKGSVAAVTKAISDTKAFSDDDLQQLKALEASGQNRKSLITAIEEELLERASDLAGAGLKAILAGPDAAKLIAAEEKISITELDTLAEAEQSGAKRVDVLLAIQARLKAAYKAAAEEILADKDPVAKIETTDLSLSDLTLLEELEVESKDPREQVQKAIEAKRAELEAQGKPGTGLLGLFRKKK